MRSEWRKRNEDDTARQKLLEDRMKEQVPAAIDLELKKQPDWKNANETVCGGV